MSFQTPIVIDEDGFIDLSNKRKRLRSEDYDSEQEQGERMTKRRYVRRQKKTKRVAILPEKTKPCPKKTSQTNNLSFSVSDIESDSDLDLDLELTEKKEVVQPRKLTFHIDHIVPYDATPSDDDEHTNVLTNDDKRVRIKSLIVKK